MNFQEINPLIFAVIALIATVVIFRFVGAWMLRINEVISELKEINKKLELQNIERGISQPKVEVEKNKITNTYHKDYVPLEGDDE